MAHTVLKGTHMKKLSGKKLAVSVDRVRTLTTEELKVTNGGQIHRDPPTSRTQMEPTISKTQLG